MMSIINYFKMKNIKKYSIHMIRIKMENYYTLIKKIIIKSNLDNLIIRNNQLKTQNKFNGIKYQLLN